jgi:hypothetical protein
MRHACALAVLCFGCAARSEVADACLVERTEEPLTRSCLPTTLEPESNPESPSYGQVNCAMIVSGVAGTPFCDCTSPGFARASDAQAELAREENRVRGLCLGTCCEDLCSCVLPQLSGDALAACQWPDESETSPRGWCYVEPDAGWGDPSTVAECPSTQRRLIRVVPKGIINHKVATLACID